MTVDIIVREKNGKREIRFPILPEEISLDSGNTTFASYSIMGRGEVAVPAGTELSTYSWESELPGELRKHDPMIRGTWQAPESYHNILEDWKLKGTKLNLLVVGYPYINKDVYVKEYKPVAAGPFGDLVYKIAFIEARDITIKTTTVENPPTKRPATQGTSYTIKKGDNLWAIARKFYGSGSKWKIIYDANKEIIESTAKARWKAAGINRDSENGHWIFPGVMLTIPDAS